MKKTDQLLKDFLTQKLKEQGFELEENILQELVNSVEIEEGEPDVEEETRNVHITERTDGSFEANSIKFYNLLNAPLTDIYKFVAAEVGILVGMGSDPKIKVFFALLVLILEFSSKFKQEVNEQDAKILFLISGFPKSPFDANKIGAAYQDHFGTALPKENVQRSLNYLTDLRIIRFHKNEVHYTTRERIIYERHG